MTVMAERKLTGAGSGLGRPRPRQTLRAYVADGHQLHDTGHCGTAWWCARHDNYDSDGEATLIEHTRRIAEMSLDHGRKVIEVVVAWPEILEDGAPVTHPHAAIWVYEDGDRSVIALSAHLTGSPNWICGELADVLVLLGEGRWLADALHSAHALLCQIDFRRRQAAKSTDK